MDATATSPADYTGVTDFPVVFNAGEDTKEIQIAIADDNVVENDEIFKLSLKCEESPCTKVVPNQAVVVIKSDDGKCFLLLLKIKSGIINNFKKIEISIAQTHIQSYYQMRFSHFLPLWPQFNASIS